MAISTWESTWDRGHDVAEAIWQSGGSACTQIWGYEKEVNEYLDENYPVNTGNWKTDACHSGIQKGAEQVVDQYENQCLDDTPEECNDLGQAAASKCLHWFTFLPINNL